MHPSRERGRWGASRAAALTVAVMLWVEGVANLGLQVVGVVWLALLADDIEPLHLRFSGLFWSSVAALLTCVVAVWSGRILWRYPESFWRCRVPWSRIWLSGAVLIGIANLPAGYEAFLAGGDDGSIPIASLGLLQIVVGLVVLYVLATGGRAEAVVALPPSGATFGQERHH